METFEVITLLGGILVGLGLAIGCIGLTLYYWGSYE